MLLYANGCSMTMGLELSDPAASCYPSLLAKSLGTELFNEAQGGSSNCRILRTSLLWICTYLQNGGRPDDLFVLIGWSSPDRREVALSSQEHASDPNDFWRSINIRHSLQGAPPDFVRLRELIIKSFWCSRESMTRFLVAINSLQGFLLSNAIRFCFSHAMPIGPLHPELTPLVRSVDRDRFFRFMGARTDFLNSCADAGIPAGPGSHPLEQGHERWAADLATFIAGNCLL